jgi:hypothetical protein
MGKPAEQECTQQIELNLSMLAIKDKNRNRFQEAFSPCGAAVNSGFFRQLKKMSSCNLMLTWC